MRNVFSIFFFLLFLCCAIPVSESANILVPGVAESTSNTNATAPIQAPQTLVAVQLQSPDFTVF